MLVLIWIAFIFLFSAPAMACTAEEPGCNPDFNSLPANTWVKLNPTIIDPYGNDITAGGFPHNAFSGAWYASSIHALLLFGGGGHGRRRGNDVWRYDTALNRWQQLYTPDPQTTYPYSQDNTGLTFEQYCRTPGADPTHCNPDPVLFPIRGATSVGRPWTSESYDQSAWDALNGKLVFFGPGFIFGHDLPYWYAVPDAFTFDPQTLQWTHMDTYPNRHSPSGASEYDPVNQVIIAVLADQAWSLDVMTGQWSRKKDLSGFFQGVNMVFSTWDQKLYIFGNDYPATNKLWSYQTSADTWTQITPIPDPIFGLPPPSAPSAAFDTRNNVILIWGKGGIGTYTGTWAYHVPTNMWRKMNPIGGEPSLDAGVGNRLNYDPVNDVFFLLVGTTKFGLVGGMFGPLAELWAYRYSSDPAPTQSETTAEDTAKLLTLSASSENSPALTFSIGTPPAHGTLSALDAPNCTPSGSGSSCTVSVTYTPAADFNGADSFTFVVSDEIATAPGGTVLLAITPVNDAPTASAQSVSVPANTATALTMGGTDEETAPANLSLTIVTPPAHGSLTGAGLTRAYTPDANYTGPDSFTFTVADRGDPNNCGVPGPACAAALTSAAATVSLMVANPAPSVTALSPNSAMEGGSAFTLTVTGSNFIPGSVVGWNGADRATTFVAATQLQAAIAASDIASAGTAQVTVFTPAPGGGTSNARAFTITGPALPPGSDIIIDNGTAGTSFTGSWCVSGVGPPFGANSLYSCGLGGDTYRWTPTMPEAATYDVYMWWTAHALRSAAVPMTVVHAGGTTTKNVNQQINGGQWVLHGRYSFNAGTGGYVQLSDANGQADADAVRFSPSLPDTAPPSAPTGVQATAISGTQIKLSWAASTDNVEVAGYLVERCAGPNCTDVTPIAAPTTTVYLDGGLSPSMSYSYQIKAVDAVPNVSAPSALLVSATTSAVADFIIDNGTAGTSFTGTWCVSGVGPPFGANSLYSCGLGGDTYRWTPTMPEAATYDVYMWWTAHALRSAAVPMTVVHAGGTTTKNVNQQVNGGQWVLHGRYSFNAGTGGYVQLSDANGQADADAVRFVPVSSAN